MDVHAISTALAARFTSAYVTPPSGYANIASSTAEVPDALGSLPAVVVYPPDGSWGYTAGSMRTGDLSYTVRVFLGTKHNTPRGAVLVNKWHSVLLDLNLQQAALGQASNGVTHSYVTASRAGALTHADIEYFGVELQVTVHVVEAISPAQ